MSIFFKILLYVFVCLHIDQMNVSVFLYIIYIVSYPTTYVPEQLSDTHAGCINTKQVHSYTLMHRHIAHNWRDCSNPTMDTYNTHQQQVIKQASERHNNPSTFSH